MKKFATILSVLLLVLSTTACDAQQKQATNAVNKALGKEENQQPQMSKDDIEKVQAFLAEEIRTAVASNDKEANAKVKAAAAEIQRLQEVKMKLPAPTPEQKELIAMKKKFRQQMLADRYNHQQTSEFLEAVAKNPLLYGWYLPKENE